jgi:hypothetical protein
LLKNATKTKKVHADASYKVIWEEIPILISGGTDMIRLFHPYGINICTNEKTADFIFVFKSLVDSLKTLGEELNVKTLISDASNSIRNAFKEVFGVDTLLIMCWVHMRRNVVKHLHFLDDEL